MAKPRRSSPARDILFRVDESDAKRAESVALQATHEAAKIVPVPEMYRRAFLAGLSLVESCAGCRAGKCDAQHVSINGLVCQDEPQKKAPVERKSAEPLDNSRAGKASKVDQDEPKTSAGQVDLFFAQATPEPEAPKKKRAPMKRAYPEGFVLTDDMRAYAVKNGIAPERVDGMFEHFSNHHRAKGSMFVDWTLAFYTWVRNDKQYGGKNQARTDTRPRSTQDEPLPRDWP